MLIHSTSKVFDHIEIMLKSLYSYNTAYANVVFILGYIDIRDGIESIRSKYPGKKIITYQLEQLFYGSRWVSKTNIEFLKKSDQVWDYDEENIRFLYDQFKIKAMFMPLQYVPQLTMLPLLDINKHDIDILFYGSLNDKRRKVIDSIKTKLPNRNIISSDVLWDDELNDHIQRSKIILNLHYYDTNRLEQARIFFLLANHKCVVSETSPINYYQSGIVMADTEKISDACEHLLRTKLWYPYANEAIKTLILSNQVFKGWVK